MCWRLEAARQIADLAPVFLRVMQSFLVFILDLLVCKGAKWISLGIDAHCILEATLFVYTPSKHLAGYLPVVFLLVFGNNPSSPKAVSLLKDTLATSKVAHSDGPAPQNQPFCPVFVSPNTPG